MADKPSRSLVVYADGFAPLVSSEHSHLHALASLACCGFLAVRCPPSSVNENDRVVRELAQLLDAYDYYDSLKGENRETGDQKLKQIPSIQTISERFMGLKAAIISASASTEAFARDIGLAALEMDDLIGQTEAVSNHQKDTHIESSMAEKLLALLGFSSGEVLDKSEFDLLIFHVRANEIVKVLKDKMIIKTDVDWLNNFVGGIMQMTSPKSKIASRLHFSLIASYGTVSEKQLASSPVTILPPKMNSDLSLLRPRQSFTMKEGKLLNDVWQHFPMLIAQWQEAVTRKDMAEEFSFKEFEKHGANLTILAERFLHEVAFKLWKAPKYGA